MADAQEETAEVQVILEELVSSVVEQFDRLREAICAQKPTETGKLYSAAEVDSPAEAPGQRCSPSPRVSAPATRYSLDALRRVATNSVSRVGQKSKRGVRDSALQGKSALAAGLLKSHPLMNGRNGGPQTALRKSASSKDLGGVGVVPSGGIGNGVQLDEELVLKFSPASKKRRTTIGRPLSTQPQGGFVAHLIAKGRTWEDDTRSLEELLGSLGKHFTSDGQPRKDRILLSQMLKTGVLVGQPVVVKSPSGGGLEISGRLVENGKIACNCPECEGDLVGLAEFEEHSGAPERTLSHSIHLSKHGVSLMELSNAVNLACGRDTNENEALQKPLQQARQCHVCNLSSPGLLRCGGGCKTRAHTTCVGFDSSYSGPWSCLNCMESRAKWELEKAEEAKNKAVRRAQKALEVAQARAAESRRASSRLLDIPKSGQQKKAGAARPSVGAQRGSKPQRVHMAAPTAKVGLSQGRMVRNSNKHKRLFDPDEPNGVKDGEKVMYKTTQGEKLLDGEIRVSRQGPCGILCSCCNNVVSCSQFEAHAGRGSRRAPYDNIFTMAGITLRRLAAALPSEAPIYREEAEDEQDAVQEDMLGGCVLCKENTFQRDGFSDLTVILCDQCEREFHVGCLRKHKEINLEGLPEGDWFCCGKCQEIHADMHQRVLRGPMTIDADYQWQLYHGKDGSHGTTWALKACYEILQESFDPIIDQISGQDLVKGMVYSMQQGEWDHTGMFTAVLRHKKQPVCALVMRAFGDMLAEVPLIATRLDARRKGHARYLMNALADLLAEVGVRTMSLPAAHATVETWTQGFGFQPMAADQLLETRESLRLLVFPGTEVLFRVLLPNAKPYPAPKRDKSPPAAVAAEQSADGKPADADGPPLPSEAAPPEQSGEQGRAVETLDRELPTEAKGNSIQEQASPVKGDCTADCPGAEPDAHDRQAATVSGGEVGSTGEDSCAVGADKAEAVTQVVPGQQELLRDGMDVDDTAERRQDVSNLHKGVVAPLPLQA